MAPATPGRPAAILRWIAGFAAMLALSLLTRWGSLATEVIDWDESTMILMGAELVDGRLPYVTLWDIKPPFLFFVLGAAMTLFGEHLAVVRGVGVLCIAVAAFAMAGIATRWLPFGRALLVGGALVAGASIMPLQPMMTEQMVLATLCPALWLLVAARDRALALFWAGLLMGLAVLTRTNLAFPALATGLWLLGAAGFARGSVPRLGWLAFAAGAALPQVMFLALYAAAGHGALYIDTLIRVPVLYSSGQTPLLANLAILIGSWGNMALRFPLQWAPITTLALAGAWLAYRRRHGNGGRPNRTAILSGAGMLATIGAATALGMAANGSIRWHHTLPILPFVVLGLVPLLARGRLGPLLVALSLSVILALTGPASLVMLRNGPGTGNLQTLAAQITADATPQDRVLALEDHLLYWYLDRPLLSPIAVHPSGLVRPAILDGAEQAGIVGRNAFAEVLAARPRYIVLRESVPPWYLRDRPEGTALMDVLARDYTRWTSLGVTVIYRRD